MSYRAFEKGLGQREGVWTSSVDEGPVVDLDSSTISSYSTFGPLFASSAIKESTHTDRPLRKPKRCLLELTFGDEESDHESERPSGRKRGRRAELSSIREDAGEELVEVKLTQKKRFECAICQRPFTHKNSSKAHEYTHMNWEELEKTNVYHANCDQCQRTFFRKQHYTEHIDVHNKIRPHKFPQCPRKFTHKGALRSHSFTHLNEGEQEKKKKKFGCNFCEKKFRTTHNLNNHLYMHTLERWFPCDQCTKAFKRKNDLTVHQRSHREETRRPFKCDQCQRAFPQKSDLKRHLKLHLGQKDFSCLKCGKSFTHKFDMTRHYNAIHVGERPSCPKCSRSFTQKRYLTQHKKHCNN